MSWFSDLAGKAENLLTNLDEQAGAALRNQNVLNKQKKSPCLRNEPAQIQKKRPQIPRSKNYPKNPPATQPSSLQRFKDQRHGTPPKVPLIKIPAKKYSLNNCPRTMVDNIKDDSFPECYGYKPRRYSLPEDLGDISDQAWIQRMETLGVENAMLKNELNVTNREIKELLERLHITEKELLTERNKLGIIEVENHKLNMDKNALEKAIEQQKCEIANLTNVELSKHKEQKRELQTEISVLRERNKELDELFKLYGKQDQERDAEKIKMANDLRHAQSTIQLLQSDLNKSREECKRLENEWESYKLRVKNMLASKDKEIKSLQQGVNLTEDTKILVEQIENLKGEREVLSEAVSQVRGECGDMKHYMESMEAKHTATERVVLALREALREERAVRIKAETSCNNLAKELKSVQIELGQTIATLRATLREKENELSLLNRMQDIPGTSSMRTIESSAINVADFGAKFTDSFEDKEKINHLTKKLIQRQDQIDLLMADNNMLKIQLEKLESKSKTDVQSALEHSVVSFQDGSYRLRSVHNSISLTGKMSRWFGVLIRSHPLFRVFIVMYMVCLHIWVFTVLLTSTPDTKSYYYHTMPQILNPN